MGLAWRRKYARAIGILFLVFFVLFGLTAAFTVPLWGAAGGKRLLFGLCVGFAAGWGFAGIAGGVWYTLRWIIQRPMQYKNLFLVLGFPFIYMFMMLGALWGVPYALFACFTVGRARRKNPDAPWESGAIPDAVDTEALARGDERAVLGGMSVYLFADTTAAYLAGIAGAVLLFWVCVWPGRVSPGLALLVLAAALGGVAALSLRATRRKMGAVADILYRDCDPELFNAHMLALLEKWQTAENRGYIQLQLANGLLDAGEDTRALELVEALRVRPGKGAKERLAKLAHALFCCYLACDELEKAEKKLEQLAALVQRLPEGGQAEMQALCAEDEILYRLALGQSEGVAEYFAEAFAKRPLPYSKVYCQHYMAMAFFLDGEAEKGIQALAYVGQHGGTLQIAAEAREQLARLAGRA